MPASRWIAFAALTLPVAAGLLAMANQGAPPAYLLGNSAGLAIALVWIFAGRGPDLPRPRQWIMLVLLAITAIPLFTGPDINGIGRWIAAGPVMLHAGMLTIPALCVLAAQDDTFGPPALLTAAFLVLLQPDAASLFALTFAAVGIHHATRNWKWGLAAVLSFLASLSAALRGELPAQPFVERVLVDLVFSAPLLALVASVSLLAGFLLIAIAAPFPRSQRLALAGTLFGSSMLAIISNYPSVLIGYGASPILGYGLALGLSSRKIT